MGQKRGKARRMSVDEYLKFEERSSARHEYVAGEVYAMTGATVRHGLITLNIARHLHGASGAHGCRIVVTDLKLRAAADRFYYPDVLVFCGKTSELDLIVDDPSVVVEVTSPSIRATDRREKLDAYLKLASLRTYLIVEQRRKHLVAYTRGDEGEWQREEIEQGEHGEQGGVAIPVLHASLPSTRSTRAWRCLASRSVKRRNGTRCTGSRRDSPSNAHHPRALTLSSRGMSAAQSSCRMPNG